MTRPTNDMISEVAKTPLWAFTMGQARFSHDLVLSGSTVARGAL